MGAQHSQSSSSGPSHIGGLTHGLSAGSLGADDGVLYKESFGKAELSVLDSMFRDLAERSPDDTMDKATFLRFFNLPGLLGERLFTVFDTKKNGVIDYEEFIHGLARFSRGSMDEKIALLFEMYDLNGEGSVSREELSTMLHSLVKPPWPIVDQDDDKQQQQQQQQQDAESKADMHSTDADTVERVVQQAFDRFDVSDNGVLGLKEFQRWLLQQKSIISDLETVFVQRCWSDPRFSNAAAAEEDGAARKRQAQLRKKQRKKAQNGGVERQHSIDEARFMAGMSKPDRKMSSEPSLTSWVACTTCGWEMRHCMVCSKTLVSSTFERQECSDCGDKNSITVRFCAQCSSALEEQESGDSVMASPSQAGQRVLSNRRRSLSNVHLQATTKSSVESADETAKSGPMWKRGRRFKKLAERWYVVYHSFLYVYAKSTSRQPSRVVFLDGCFIEFPDPDDKDAVAMAKHDPPLFGLDVVTPSRTLRLYVRSVESRQNWVRVLRAAANALPIQEFFQIGQQIAAGRFSKVHQGVSLRTGAKCAIKVIDKVHINANEKEKEALRTEVAVLKLVRHPAVVRTEGVFETRDKMFIVMSLMQSGDLFDRIMQRKFFTEDVARVIMFKLMSGIRYLHARGIVHRDLKPENILCGSLDDDTSVFIADFGLSKFARPTEVMSMPCGTLAYVAPEVLRLKGYSRAVDLWSLGVIMYLLMRGGLPFDGMTKRDIVERTLHAQVSFQHERWKYVSEAAKDLIQQLLKKDPRERIGIRAALEHDWFLPLTDAAKHGRSNSISLTQSEKQLVRDTLVDNAQSSSSQLTTVDDEEDDGDDDASSSN